MIAYRRALEWLPWREDLHIQIGNCLKEYGDYRAAVAAYSRVTSGVQRPEALKQMADDALEKGAKTPIEKVVVLRRIDVRRQISQVSCPWLFLPGR